MGRVINSETAGKQRGRLNKALLLTMRELGKKKDIDAETRDMVAFIALCLHEMHETIEVTCAAWEKRDYWIKADRFRRDWAWTKTYYTKLSDSVLQNDWAEIPMLLPAIAQQSASIKLPKSNTIGTAWNGALTRLKTLVWEEKNKVA